MIIRRVASVCLCATVVAGCGGHEHSAPTKNLALGTNPSVLAQRTLNPGTAGKTTPTNSSPWVDDSTSLPPLASDGGECSPLGAIHQSNPVVVSPPEPNSAEQSYSGGECSFYEQYRSFPGIGRYEFIWDAATTPQSTSGRPAVIEVSRNGITWTTLATQWSPKKPHSAVAYLTMAGNLRIRVRAS